jgi:hypothetical protein
MEAFKHGRSPSQNFSGNQSACGMLYHSTCIWTVYFERPGVGRYCWEKPRRRDRGIEKCRVFERSRLPGEAMHPRLSQVEADGRLGGRIRLSAARRRKQSEGCGGYQPATALCICMIVVLL